MKFEIERKRIVVTPQNVLDEAYIEDTLDLKEDGDYILLKRKNSIAEPSIFELITEHTPRTNFLEIKKEVSDFKNET